METRNPGYREMVERVFRQAGFVRDLGVELADVGPGWCETTLAIGPRHLQQDGLVHAGVQATLGDHTAGAAAATLVAANEYVLTLEFKINLWRAARGTQLVCRGEVVKPGKSFSFVESSVFVVHADRREQVSSVLATIAVLERPK